MAVDNPRALFAYELGITYDSEVSSASMFSFLAMRVRDEGLRQILREIEQSKRRQLENIDTCLDVVGLTPLQSPSPTEQGLRQRFEAFTKMQPSPEAVDLFALGVAVRSKHFAITNYQELVDLAGVVGDSRCEEPLRSNINTKRDNLAKLEQYAPEVRDRFFAMV